jgi:hypothetical protein
MRLLSGGAATTPGPMGLRSFVVVRRSMTHSAWSAPRGVDGSGMIGQTEVCAFYMWKGHEPTAENRSRKRICKRTRRDRLRQWRCKKPKSTSRHGSGIA